MNVSSFFTALSRLEIDTLIGVPDSTLKPLCSYMQQEGVDGFSYDTAANEGCAIGMAIGHYLSTGRPACVYMQNSGLGNAVNPLTSLAHREVYDIPVLLLIGWRGQPGTKDEPQHRFMGRITEDMLRVLEIEYAVIRKSGAEKDLSDVVARAGDVLKHNRQFAVLVERGALEYEGGAAFGNGYTMVREEAVRTVLLAMEPQDIMISTTGKISREVYEQSEALFGRHDQAFLTVGGMGHASMIAYGMAQKFPSRRVYCLEGDGAVLMHMGNLAMLGQKKPQNFIHICLNNQAHESVGGMPTCAVDLALSNVASACGYPFCRQVETPAALKQALQEARNGGALSFIEGMVSMGARSDLGRPKEAAVDNKKSFMQYHLGGKIK